MSDTISILTTIDINDDNDDDDDDYEGKMSEYRWVRGRGGQKMAENHESSPGWATGHGARSDQDGPGYPGNRIPGYPDTWIPGYLGSKTHGYLVSNRSGQNWPGWSWL